MNANVASMSVADTLKKMHLKDLRAELRAHGQSPAGNRDTLLERYVRS